MNGEFPNYQAAVNWRAYRALLSAGVPSAGLLRDGDFTFGITTAQTEVDGTWQPAEVGRRVVVVSDGVELLAFQPASPLQWWRRFGAVSIFNASAIDRARQFNEMLPIFGDPLGWLRQGSQGVVIVDWSCPLRAHLGGVANVACDSDLLAAKLHCAMSEPVVPVPSIRVIQERAADVAA